MSAQFAVRRGEIADLVKRIRSAIRDELNASSRGLPFRVCDIAPKGALLYMTLTPEDKNSILDETLEEGNMRWQGETTGGAEIVSVVPSLSVINACLTEGQPPLKGSLIYVNPPRYLEALLSVWEDDLRAAEIAQWIFNLDKNRIIWDKEVPCSVFKGLRPAQERSFSLVKWKTSFLWGPPGTGKTYTLGRLLASYLLHYPNDRVLLLSSTNVAVDLAILAVEDAFTELKPKVRPTCYRFGSRFDPERFQKAKHLIPLRNKQLVDKLRDHYQKIPDPAQADRYLKWKEDRDRLRNEIRTENLAFLNSARLVAMTATLAAHDYEDLGKFDLVVFDEASQVGKAQAATFASLGARSLFAGDPMQLAPVAQATSDGVRNWLGQSPFKWSEHSSMEHAQCMLDEQWRMAEPICSAVSDLFYDSKLRMSDPARDDEEWVQKRQPRPTRLLEKDDSVILVDVGAAAKVAHGFRGYECEESATLIAALVVDHVRNWSIANIRDQFIVLTPYRAQRRKIEAMLSSINSPAGLVSTVHRAQGSERPIVIFDPVCPTAEFVKDGEGMRLVNVAFSRAQCRLIVMLESGWGQHPALQVLAERHPPVILPRGKVDELLWMKLPSLPPPTIASDGGNPSRRPIFEEFLAELREMVLIRRSNVDVKRAAEELLDKAKFKKKVTWEQTDKAIDIVERLKGRNSGARQ